MAVGFEIVSGLLSSILYDGLKRPIRGAGDLLTRRKAINKSLTSIAAQDVPTAEMSSALQDVARVLGNDHDAYSDDVASFLREVERSAIPDAMKQFALCGHPADEVYPAFDVIYRSYPSLGFSSRSLFDAINAAITTRISQSVQDRTMFEALKAQNEHLANRITALSACLKNAGTLGVPLEAKVSEELRVKIARGIEVANRQVNVETTQGTRRVPIKRLVIPARLNQVRERSQIPSAHREAPLIRSPSTSYLTFRRTFNRTVILGDPGGGKSTLTQQLCFDLAHQIVLASGNPGVKQFDSRDMQLPLRIILRTLEHRQQVDPSYQIFNYLVDEIRVHCENDSELAARFLRQALALGHIALLFDGLDEILDIGSRRTMAVMIEQFSIVYSSCSALVTSRIVGYNDAPLNDDFDLMTLARFNPEEVRKFCEQLLRAINNENTSVSKKKADEFIRQTDSNATDLRENPLLLGLMVYIYNARGEVPNNRPEIYRECSLLMFEKWDQRRDIKFEFPQDFDLLDLFGFLATQIFGSAETEDGVDEAWLTEKLRSYFNTWYQDKARSVAAARVLVDFVTGRAWVMCEIGPGMFKFTHRTFLEYFYAKRIEEEAGSVGVLINGHLMQKILAHQQDVVSHLALQIATFRSGPKSLQAGEALLKVGMEAHLSPEEEENFLFFFAGALKYLLLPEKNLSEIVGYISKRCIHLGANYSLGVKEIIHEILDSTSRRRDVSRETLYEVIRPIIEGPDSPERTYALYLLGTRFSGYRLGKRISDNHELIWNEFSKLRSEIRDREWERAQASIEAARTYIHVFSSGILDLYKIHGFRLLWFPQSKLVPFGVSACALGVLHEALRAKAQRAGHQLTYFTFERAEAEVLLTQISDFLMDKWRDGEIEGDLVPLTGELEYSIFADMMTYLDLLARQNKRKAGLNESIARTAFSYVILSGGFLSAERFNEMSRIGRRSGSPPFRLSAYVDLGAGNEFSVALRRFEEQFLGGTRLAG